MCYPEHMVKKKIEIDSLLRRINQSNSERK